MSYQEDYVDVSEEAKILVRDIITNNNFSSACTVKYYPGSQAGDGFATKTYAVDIYDDTKSLHVFLKCALKLGDKFEYASQLYTNETYFFKTIYPTYTEFWKNKGIKDDFRNVPESYGFNETEGSEIIALENLRTMGYTLFDRFTCMNDQHMKLTLRAFAQFHAISFAIKDQRKELHDEFCARGSNIFASNETTSKMSYNTVKGFLEKLDPIEDKDILQKRANLDSIVCDKTKNIDDLLNEYSILIKGDCWVNNMMVMYKDNDKEHPIDVMLIDWQCIMHSSPVMDIQSLFYSVASKEIVDNYKDYLDIYYEELCKIIKELGSDPGVLYPRSAFDKEWIDYGMYALGLSLVLVKIMLCQSVDAPNMESAADKNEIADIFSNVKHDEAEYLVRAKYIVRHMMDIGIV